MKLNESLALSESGFIFLPTTGETFTANEVGRVVLHAMQEGKNEAEILKVLLKEFEVEEAILEKDIPDFIAQLKQYNLVEEERSA